MSAGLSGARNFREYQVDLGSGVQTLDLGAWTDKVGFLFKDLVGTGSVAIQIGPDGANWATPVGGTIVVTDSNPGEGENSGTLNEYVRHIRVTPATITGGTMVVVALV